jgi:hypothetical protein
MNKKNYLLGLYILFLPLFLFLDAGNLRQISSKSITFILFSILIIFFFIFIFEKIFSFFFKLKIKNNIFPGLCFAFYLQFYYSQIKLTKIGELTNSGYIITIFLILLGIFIIFLWSRYSKFLNKFSLIFSVFITFTFIYNFYIFSKINTNRAEITSIKKNYISDQINKNKSFNNVYFIIFDGMTPLEIFKNHLFTDYNTKYGPYLILKKSDLDIDAMIKQFNKDSFKYIKNSFSNYNSSGISVASILNNDYFINDKSEKFKNYKNFYPSILYDENKARKLNLLNILEKNKIKFVWVANSHMPCKNTLGIICGSESKVETDILNEVKSFYAKTPIIGVLDDLTKSLRQEIPSDNFLNHIKSNKDKNNFFFIHNIIPNGVALYDDNCNEVEKEYFIHMHYDHKYLCSIKKIKEITNLISKHDSDSVVIITADHGVRTGLLEKKTILTSDIDGPNYDPRIFTLIKFPEECSKITPKFYDSLNLIRYAINCTYSEKFDYLPYSFFRTYPENHKNFGSLMDSTKEVEKYLNKLEY